MKRTITVILLLVLLLSSCIDASFDGSAEESSENTTETYIYAPVSIWCEKTERDGITIAEAGFYFVLCRVNCDTGNAVPVCTAEGCHHNTDGCIACGANVSDVTDDGKTLCFWDRLSENHDSENPDYEALIEYDTEKLSYKELLRTEYNQFNDVLMAFGDGLVYNIFVEVGADSGEPAVENRYYKLGENGSERICAEASSKKAFVRCGNECMYPALDPDGGRRFLRASSRLEDIGEYNDYAQAMGWDITTRASTADGKTGSYVGEKGSGNEYLATEDFIMATVTDDYYVFVGIDTGEEEMISSGGRELCRGQLLLKVLDYRTGERNIVFDFSSEAEKLGLCDVTQLALNINTARVIYKKNLVLLSVYATDIEKGVSDCFGYILDADEKTVIRVR